MDTTRIDGTARGAGTDDTAAIAAIRRLVADAQRFQSDPDRFIALHSADPSIVNFGGRRVRGRDALYQAMTAALATPLAQVITTTEIEDIRFIAPDVAIVACVKHVSDERDTSTKEAPGAALSSTSGRLTYVLAREGDAWLIASAQTTPIMS